MPMIREDGRTERQAVRTAVKKPPAWLGRQATRPTGNGGSNSGGGGGGGNRISDLWETIRSRLNNSQYIAPTSMGGTAPVANFNTPESITQGQQTYAQNNPIPRAVAAPTPGQFQTPAWLATIQSRLNNSPFIRPTSMGGNAPIPNFNTPESITQGQRRDDGNVYNPNEPETTPQGTPTQGVNSFIGGGGDAVIGPNGYGYTPWAPAGVNTFIGAGGQAVRGPVGQPVTETASAGIGSGGFGSSYGGNWRSGGGGGGGGGYGGYSTPAWMSNDPQYMNLYSWNYKG